MHRCTALIISLTAVTLYLASFLSLVQSFAYKILRQSAQSYYDLETCFVLLQTGFFCLIEVMEVYIIDIEFDS